MAGHHRHLGGWLLDLLFAVAVGAGEGCGIEFSDKRKAAEEGLGEAHALFERLGDFFVVERVAGRIDQSPTICESNTAPGIQQANESGPTAFPRGTLPALVQSAAGRLLDSEAK